MFISPAASASRCSANIVLSLLIKTRHLPTRLLVGTYALLALENSIHLNKPILQTAGNIVNSVSCPAKMDWQKGELHQQHKREMHGTRAAFAKDEKEKYLHMPLESKREHYACHKDYVTLEAVLTWQQYAADNAYLFSKSAVQTNITEDKNLNQKISLWRGDITKLEIDAIVNAANPTLMGGGGVDGAIHRAAGPSLKAECATLHGCETGNAKITGGYKLPAKYVIHTVGPQGEKPDLLQGCYYTCMKMALENEIRSIAFPCISTGIYGYPNKNAAPVAVRTIRKFLLDNPDKFDRIIFCVFLPEDVHIYEQTLRKYFPVTSEGTKL